MEKRLLIAVLLMSAVIMITNQLFPPPAPPTGDGQPTAPDSLMVENRPAAAEVRLPAQTGAGAVQVDTVTITSPLYRFSFSTRGAALIEASLLEYPSYTEDGPVQLVPAGVEDFLTHQLVIGADTLDLSSLPFAPSTTAATLSTSERPLDLTFTYQAPTGFEINIAYTFHPDRYLVDVRGTVTGLGDREATLLASIGPALEVHEAFEHHSERDRAVVSRVLDDFETVKLDDLEGAERLPGPLTWTGIKDKYFLAALIAGTEEPFTTAVVEDRPDEQLIPLSGEEDAIALPRGELTAALPVDAGTFGYQIYLGPQDYERLAAIGYDLEEVTPYGYRWLQSFIRPIAGAILWVLGVLHTTLGIEYGWVLVLFGVLMRVVVWPLNGKAMRAQMKNMAVQPLMQEIREKYKDDPQAQQREMVRLYKEEGFNPVAGCLPMLIPMPILITLFFVFQNTIVFRGAEFLWLPDLSLPDPYYILPLFLVTSMFALQWVSAKMSGMEQNAQLKVMMYVMPLMMGILFFNLPAGLNLYYATTNIASLPQQILIARERKKAQAELKKDSKGKAPPAASPRKGGKKRAKRK